MIRKIIFCAVVVGLIYFGIQNNWFSPVTQFFDNVKADIDNQKNFTPEEEEIDDHGVLTVEKEDSKVVRRSALGKVMR